MSMTMSEIVMQSDLSRAKSVKMLNTKQVVYYIIISAES